MNNQENFFSWQVEIPLINNPFILLNVLKGLMLTLIILFIILGLILGLTNGITGLKMALFACFWVGIFYIFISIFTLLIVLGNRYPLEFIINNEGIIMQSQSKRAKGAHRLALILGLLGGGKGTMAAGASGIHSEVFKCPWKGIKSVKLYPEKKVVAAKQNFIQIMYVFCTEENFSQVSEVIMKNLNFDKKL